MSVHPSARRFVRWRRPTDPSPAIRISATAGILTSERHASLTRTLRRDDVGTAYCSERVREAEATRMNRSIRDQFAEDGFLVLRGILPLSDVAFYIERLKALAGGAPRWTQPDGVNRNPAFWPIIFNE